MFQETQKTIYLLAPLRNMFIYNRKIGIHLAEWLYNSCSVGRILITVGI